MSATVIHEMFFEVEEYLENAHLIAWDGCHKIYVAMDETEAEWFRRNYNGSDDTSETFHGTPEEMIATLVKWYDESCWLRFVTAVRFDPETMESDFTYLIEQGEDWEVEYDTEEEDDPYEEEEEEDEDEDDN